MAKSTDLLSNICRICVRKVPSLCDMFEEQPDGLNFAVKLSIFTGLEISVYDDLPKNICKPCRRRTKECFEFHKLCMSSEESLQKVKYELYGKTKEIKVKAEEMDIEEVDVKEEEIEEVSYFLYLEGDSSAEDDLILNDVKRLCVENDLSAQKSVISAKESVISAPKSVISAPKSVISAKKSVASATGVHRKYKCSVKEDPIKKYKCKFCKKKFASEYRVKLHMQRLHKQIYLQNCKFLCRKCGMKFEKIRSLQRHLVYHNTDSYYECNFCEKALFSKKSLRKHIRIHDEKINEICKICNKTIVSKVSYYFHSEYHRTRQVLSNKTFFSCKTCNLKFKSFDEIADHSLTIHNLDSTIKNSLIACLDENRSKIDDLDENGSKIDDLDENGSNKIDDLDENGSKIDDLDENSSKIDDDLDDSSSKIDDALDESSKIDDDLDESSSKIDDNLDESSKIDNLDVNNSNMENANNAISNLDKEITNTPKTGDDLHETVDLVNESKLDALPNLDVEMTNIPDMDENKYNIDDLQGPKTDSDQNRPKVDYLDVQMSNIHDLEQNSSNPIKPETDPLGGDGLDVQMDNIQSTDENGSNTDFTIKKSAFDDLDVAMSNIHEIDATNSNIDDLDEEMSKIHASQEDGSKETSNFNENNIFANSNESKNIGEFNEVNNESTNLNQNDLGNFDDIFDKSLPENAPIAPDKIEQIASDITESYELASKNDENDLNLDQSENTSKTLEINSNQSDAAKDVEIDLNLEQSDDATKNDLNLEQVIENATKNLQIGDDLNSNKTFENVEPRNGDLNSEKTYETTNTDLEDIENSLNTHKIINNISTQQLEDNLKSSNSAKMTRIQCANPQKITFQCNICRRLYTNLTDLRYHVTDCYSKLNRPKKFMCDQCGKCFSTYWTLKNHKNGHSTLRPYICDICGQRFKWHNDLTNHKARIHEKLRPYVCRICGKRCSTSATLKSHMRYHTGERPYVCSVCKATFTQNSSLKEHMYKHTGGVEGSCPICNKVFQTALRLRTHIKRHSNQRQLFPCDTCGRMFTEKSSVRKHKYKIHNRIK